MAVSPDRPPSRLRDPEPDHLVRLTASHHRLALSCRESAPNEAGEHDAAETVTADEQLLIGAIAAAGKER